MKQRAKKPRKKRRVLGEVWPKNSAVEIVKIKPRDEAEFIVPREVKSNDKENKDPKLRGGQIAFRNENNESARSIGRVKILLI